jgi:hypothetical protein
MGATGHVRPPCLSSLSWSLYAVVPSLQGTASGSRAHPGRGCEPTGGVSTFPRATFLSFVHWDFKAVA